ncbi:GNAT family N-acetyltransferase [Daejeonella sp.]|uniref:GNAT family N-acetyltransferase n=1 Tax=Daejeonella sp. TaxID=2805397 RepID=UPI0039837685
MYPELDFDKVILPNDDDGVHLGLFHENTLICVVSLFRSRTSMQFRKFATRSEYQHKGYGSEILHYILDYSKNEGCDHIWCNSRKSASDFYRKFGFLETGKTSSANGHDYVVMERNL